MILGEIAEQLIQEAGAPVVHRRELGGTQILFHALEADELDVYPEYTGTIAGEILAGKNDPTARPRCGGPGRAGRGDEPASRVQQHLRHRHARGGRRAAGHRTICPTCGVIPSCDSDSATSSWIAPTAGPGSATATGSLSATSAGSITTWPIAHSPAARSRPPTSTRPTPRSRLTSSACSATTSASSRLTSACGSSAPTCRRARRRPSRRSARLEGRITRRRWPA